jgi:SNF2 family DNA or RNA helicase
MMEGATEPVEWWADAIEDRLRDPALGPLLEARRALEHYPESALLLHLAALAALVEGQPDTCLRYLKKLNRMYLPIDGVFACEGLALAMLGRWPQAQGIFERVGVGERSYPRFFPDTIDGRWLLKWVRSIRNWKPSTEEVRKAPKRLETPVRSETRFTDAPLSDTANSVPEPLPRFSPHIPLQITLADTRSVDGAQRQDWDTPEDFVLRFDLSQTALLQTFDELLCLSHLRGVEHYWYQVETARKVLKQFRGRVLLADEVGLGKTVEAGMILKEYMLRGMVSTVLILVPASLVGQWREEMGSKFGVACATTQDSLIHHDAEAFWAQPCIIASIATARREPHLSLAARRQFDMVIVDEAHHLKTRASQNWRTVDALKKRFLLLLSATPVQNNLIELYNLLTLLKPGIFKTEREYRAIHMTPGNPRVPLKRDQLRELMRDAMIRNTRALVDVRLPPRRAVTVCVEPAAAELACYEELTRLVRSLPHEWLLHHRVALHHLLEAAGSSPRAARSSLGRFLESDPPGRWRELHERYAALPPGAKTGALLELLGRNPGEKKMVFVRFRETLRLLEEELSVRRVPFVSFEGTLAGPEKDTMIERFRNEVPVLLSTESGGEGRNVQFCNTLVNFDLPWNPQLIEQRIGRLHRIGQTREVFVFNLALRRTIEEQILRILDEKINMFELVVGEIQSILGEMEDDRSFSNLVFAAWTAATEEGRAERFAQIEKELVSAREEYEASKVLDGEVFGEDLGLV